MSDTVVSPAAAPTSTLRHLCMAAPWFAFYAQWLSIVPIVLPSQISGIVGRDAVELEGVTGTVAAAGALVALVVTPIAGAVSDRWRSPRGRRRPFLIVGTLGSSIGLLTLVPFAPGSPLWLYALAYMNLQVWWNVGAGPYAGLIADMVPRRDQGMASGWLNVMTIAGTVIGSGLALQLYRPGSAGPLVLALIAVNLACLAIVLAGVREPPSPGAAARFDLSDFMASFWVDPARNRNFYWVLVTRLINNLGIWSVLTFMQFYLEKVIAVPDPIRLLSILLGGGVLVAVPASLVGARLAARYGIVRIVGATSWIIAAAAVGYVLAAFQPQLWFVVPVGLVFSAGFGAYQAVDWLLALRVLPSSEQAGKDMGIWHVSLVLPQVVGPFISGWIISGLTLAVSARFAYLVVFCLAAAFLVAAAWLIRRVRLPDAA